MNSLRRILVLAVPVAAMLISGCASPQIDFSTLERPARAAELDAYNVFVGEWTWQAEVLNTEGSDKEWTGTAKWDWRLDDRCLHGTISGKCASAGFDAAGIWSWHPKSGKYIWWMFNNWGYPQQGTASYDDQNKRWRMDYKGVGLDGTTSYGRYCMRVVDDNTLDWSANEWALWWGMGPKKLEMKGTYNRQK